jgi:PAS domain S-box-containing protein
MIYFDIINIINIIYPAPDSIGARMKDPVRKTILVVEDDYIAAAIEKKQLECEGYEVLHSATGEAALDLVLGKKARVDLILMDIDLGPGMDGIAAAQGILARLVIPIVFLSSHTEKEVVRRTEEVTSYGYVVKSTSPTVLDASIKMAFKLFESRKIYQNTFEYALDGVCIHRMLYDDAGRYHDCEYLRVNRAYEQQTGLSMENLVGRTIRDVFPDAQVDEIIGMYAEVVSSSSALQKELYFEPLRKWFQLSVFPIADDEFSVVVQNITGLKENMLALKESETRFKALHNASFGGIAIHDKGIILECNQGLSDISGFQAHELVGMDGLQLIAEESRALVLDNIRSGYEKPYEATGLCKDGRTYPLRLEARNVPYKGKMVRVVEFRDISEIKQARTELEKNHEYLNSILQTMRDGFWAVNVDQRFTDVNIAYCRMSGYSREEFLALHISDIDAHEKPEETRAHMQHILETGHDTFETSHRRKDGSIFLVEVSVMLLKSPESRLICFCKDITDRRRDEDRIRKLLAEKELLLKETHHRVKNDMNMIYSLLCLQADDHNDDTAGNVLVDAASRMQGMMMLYDKLYRSADYESLNVRTFLPPLIDEIVRVLPCRSTIRTLVDIDDCILGAKTLSRLGIIVNEMMTNSAKYAFVGKGTGLVRVTLSKTGTGASLVYTDDGVGLPENFSLENNAGFGMRLIHMMVEELGGRLEVVSGGGARFMVTWDF